MYIKREAARELIKNFGKCALSDGRKTLDPVDDIIILAKGVDFIPAADVTEIIKPKKPVGELDGVPHFRCPNCFGAVVLYENDKHFPHCQYCGQALDWSDKK